MKKIDKNLLAKLNLYSESWIQHENVQEKPIICKLYNAENILVYPFQKPISKIINLENAPMESK